MSSSADVTLRVLSNLSLIALGYLIKRIGLIKRDEARVLNRLVLYVTLPALNLVVISSTALSWGLLLLPLISFAAGITLSLLGHWPGRALRLPRQDMGTFVISLCGVMGSLAYPFAEAGFGVDGVRAVAVSDFGNAMAIFAFAYSLSFLYGEDTNWNPRAVLKKIAWFFPLHAFLVAVLLNVTGIRLSGLPAQVASTLASANTPLMLLGLGMYLEFDVSRQEQRIVATQLAFKYGLGTLLAMFMISVLPFQGATRATAFLLPLLPSSLSTLLYSVEQGLNPRLAAMLISASLVVSLAIMTVTILGFRHAF